MSRFFTIYDPNTGKIIRAGSCPDNEVDQQVQDGEALLADVNLDGRTNSVDPATQQAVDISSDLKTNKNSLSTSPSPPNIPNNTPEGLHLRVSKLENQMTQIIDFLTTLGFKP
jgi:hypothetical protein